MATTRRLARINEVLREEGSKMLLRELELPDGVLATITRVETSEDVAHSTIFVSVYPEKHETALIKFLRRKTPLFQERYNKLLQMRPVPQIRFVADHTEAEADRIERRLQEIENKQGAVAE